MSVLTIPLRTSSNPTLSIRETNELLTTVKGIATSRRSSSGFAGADFRDTINEPLFIEVHFDDDYPAHSVFTIYKDTIGFYRPIATADAKYVVAPASVPPTESQVYVTNGTYSASAGTVLRCQIIGTHRPQLVKYDVQSPPTIGKKMKPVAGQVYLQTGDGGFVAVSEPDPDEELVWVVRDTGGTSEVTVQEVNLHLMELQEHLIPQDLTQQVVTYDAYRLLWNETTCKYDTYEEVSPGNPKMYKVVDPLGQNCVLKKERVMTVHREYICNLQALDVCEIIGSHGLRRLAQATQDVDIGQSGTCDIDGETSPQLSVTFHSIWGSCVKVYEENEIWIQYSVWDRKWVLDPHIVPRLAWTQAPINWCPGSQTPIEVTSMELKDRANDDSTFDPTDEDGDATWILTNPSNLPFTSGDRLELSYNEQAHQWEIIQVVHSEKEIVKSINDQNCPAIITKTKIYSPSCAAQDTTQELGEEVTVSDVSYSNCELTIQDYTLCVISAAAGGSTQLGTRKTVITSLTKVDEQPVGQDPRKCQLEYGWEDVCVLAGGTEQGTGTGVLWAFTKQKVIETVHDETDGLYQTPVDIFVPCLDTVVDELILEYTDCEVQQEGGLAADPVGNSVIPV